MENLSSKFILFYVLIFGTTMVAGLIWELKRRNNIKDLKDTIFTAILYLVYFIGFSLLIVVKWEKPLYYILFAFFLAIIYGAISWIRRKDRRNISKQ